MTRDTDVWDIPKVCPKVEVITHELLRAMLLPEFNSPTITLETQMLLSYNEVMTHCRINPL